MNYYYRSFYPYGFFFVFFFFSLTKNINVYYYYGRRRLDKTRGIPRFRSGKSSVVKSVLYFLHATNFLYIYVSILRVRSRKYRVVPDTIFLLYLRPRTRITPSQLC